MTKESAEARVAIEEWAAAQIAKLDKERTAALRKSPLSIQEAWRATLEEQYDKLKDTGAQMKEFTDSLYSSMADGFANIFQGALTHGFKGIQQAFSNMLKSIVNSIAKFLANHLVTRWLGAMTGSSGGSNIAGLAGGILSAGLFGGGNAINSSAPYRGTGSYTSNAWRERFAQSISSGKATGGPVSMGHAYLVGERGPEIFRPNQPGRILNSLPAGGGSNQPNIRIIINNNTSEQMTARSETKWSGSEYITSVVIDAIATNKNGMRDALKGAV